MLDDDELFAIFNVSHGSLRAVAEAARRDALEELAERLPTVADLQWELIDAKGARDTLQAKLDAVTEWALVNEYKITGQPSTWDRYHEGYDDARSAVHAILTGTTNA